MRTKHYKVTALASGWHWEDFYNIDIFEYCLYELEIPREYHNNASFEGESLELSIVTSRKCNNEDWFVNLLRQAL